MIPLTDVELPERLLANRTAFISGGSSGINLAIAHMFAALGARLLICGRNEQRLGHAADQLRAAGGEVVATVADVRDYLAVQRAFEECETKMGSADIVVCGAAGNFLAPADALTSNGFRAVMEIDLLGSFHCARAGLDQLKRTRGNILFISAGQSYMPFRSQAHVGAAKAGVDQLMRNLALEWGAYGIRANSLVPGPVGETEGMERLSDHAGEAMWMKRVPLGRYANKREIATMAAILVSPLSSYVTGAQIVVDGGLSLAGSADLT